MKTFDNVKNIQVKPNAISTKRTYLSFYRLGALGKDVFCGRCLLNRNNFLSCSSWITSGNYLMTAQGEKIETERHLFSMLINTEKA